MSDPVFGDEKIEFPVEVHFRIVCVSEEQVGRDVRAAAESLGVGDRLKRGNESRGGKYQSYQLSLVVESRERMGEIDRTFRAVDGVKMVL